MTSPPSDDEQLVTDLADSLYRILANYEREGAGPGSRFEGQTCEYAQAKFAVRTVLAWQRSREARLEQAEAAVDRVRSRASTLTAWAHRELSGQPDALHQVLSVITNLTDAIGDQTVEATPDCERP